MDLTRYKGMVPKEEAFVSLSGHALRPRDDFVNPLLSLLKLYYCSDGSVVAKPALALQDFLFFYVYWIHPVQSLNLSTRRCIIELLTASLN